MSADTEPVGSFPHTCLFMRDTGKLDVMHLVQTFTNNVAYLFFINARFSPTSKLCLYHRPGSQLNTLITLRDLTYAYIQFDIIGKLFLIDFNVMCLLQNRGTTEEVKAGHRLSYKSSQCAFVCLDLVSV